MQYRTITDGIEIQKTKNTTDGIEIEKSESSRKPIRNHLELGLCHLSYLIP
jgi:hypothetical protein